MTKSKTTIAAIITGAATVLGIVGIYLKTGTLDTQSLLGALTGLGAAFGLWKAADSQ